MNKKIVKGVFVFFLIYLPLQYAFVGIVGLTGDEPWPAFVLPAFQTVHTAEDTSEITSPYFYVQSKEGGENLEIEAPELFSGIQLSQLQGFIRKNFSGTRQYNDQAREWLKRRVENIYPDVAPSALSVIWEKTVYIRSDDRLKIDTTETQRVITISLGE